MAATTKQRSESGAYARPAPAQLGGTPAEPMETIVRDLQTWQLELELQNRELRDTQEALEQERERFQALYDCAPVSYVSLDARGVVREANATAAGFLAHSIAELVGRSFAGFLAPGQVAVFQAHLRRCAVQTRVSTELTLAIGEGAPCDVELVSLPMRGQNGMPLLHTAILDHRERRRRELATRRAVRLECLSALAGGTAHAFLTMLATVQDNADVLRQHLPTPSTEAERLERIAAACSRAADLCGDLLSFAGEGTVRPTVISVEALLRDMQTQLHMAAGGRGVQLILAEAIPNVRGEARQLCQAVLHLVRNAAESMQGMHQGEIVLRVGSAMLDRRALDRMLLGSPLASGRYLFMDVQDSGRGMDPKAMERAFDPFYTTRLGGRGLGLSGVVGMLRAHQGALDVVSRPGSGTSVRFYLPTLEARMVLPIASDLQCAGTVLLLERDESEAAALTGVLRYVGFDVVVVESEEEVLRAYAVEPQRYEAIVAAVDPGGCDVEALVQSLRRVRSDVRLLLMCDRAAAPMTKDLAQRVDVGCLARPFHVGNLTAALRSVLAN